MDAVFLSASVATAGAYAWLAAVDPICRRLGHQMRERGLSVAEDGSQVQEKSCMCGSSTMSTTRQESRKEVTCPAPRWVAAPVSFPSP